MIVGTIGRSRLRHCVSSERPRSCRATPFTLILSTISHVENQQALDRELRLQSAAPRRIPLPATWPLWPP